MITRKCHECSITFEINHAEIARGGGKYCSLSCSAKANNRVRDKTGKIFYCGTCKKRLYRKITRIKRSKTGMFFCNRECKRKAEWSNSTKNFGTNRRRHLAKKLELIEKRGIKCQIIDCPNDLMNDRRIINMHHFGDPLDHEKTVLLCPYHHRLADLHLLVFKDGRIE